MSSAQSHLSLLDSDVRNVERLCEGELCCLRHRRGSVPCVCSIRMSICITLLQVAIVELQLLWVSLFW